MDGKHILKNSSELNDYLATAMLAFFVATGFDSESHRDDIEELIDHIKFYAEEYRCLVDEGKAEACVDEQVAKGKVSVEERRKQVVASIKKIKDVMGIKDMGCDYE